MAGTFFEYFDGYLRVAFSPACRGEIYMDLTFHGDAIATIPCDDPFAKGTPEINVRQDEFTRMRISVIVTACFG